MFTKVLIAEDNMAIYSTYKDILSADKSIEIIGHAQDGLSAIEMYNKTNPDVFLLDLGLPEKNGIEIVNELSNSEESKCDIIVVSGDTELRQQLFNTKKVYRIIPKPFDSELLTQTIHKLKKEQVLSSFPKEKYYELLLKLKLKPYSRSCKVLTSMVKLAYQDISLLENMNNLYTTLAYKNHCPPQKIKESLRSSIRIANRYSSRSVLNSLFHISDDDYNNVITPKQFLNGILLHLKQ